MTTAKQVRSEDAIDDLHGRTAVVTGANSGVGFATAQLPAEQGARVIPACRNKSKGLEAAANLMFALELDHRTRERKISLASHPGAASSALLTGKEQDWSRRPRLSEVILARIQALTGQPPRPAARPSLYAATAGGLTGGEYIGPADGPT